MAHSLSLTPRAHRRAAALAAAAATALLAACGTADTGGLTDLAPDRSPPVVGLSRAVGETPDTVLAFGVSAKDNLGLKTLRVRMTGPVSGAFDTTFTTSVQTVAVPLSFKVSRSVPLGTTVLVTAQAVDGASNASKVDSLRLTVGNLVPPTISITAPVAGSLLVIGKSGVIAMSAKAALKVRMVGYVATGAFTRSDSTVLPAPFRDSLSVLDTIPVPSSATTGAVTLTPFVVDSLGQRVSGDPVSFAVQPLTAVTTIPVVTPGLNRRVEVRDTIRVAASDPTGVRVIGYQVLRASDNAVLTTDSTVLDGQLTFAEKTFTWRLPVTTYPTQVYVKAFAQNMALRRTFAKLASEADRIDTALVVAGITKPLPNGGRVADGLYVDRYDRLYLTNIERNQLEVFSLADSSFKRAVVVGSRPWGIAAWPRSRKGDIGDTLLVANSGGTNISYVAINGSGATEVYRYPLPNILLYGITTELAQGTNIRMQQRRLFDFSDRPQFLAATCETMSTSADGCGDVMLVYSTTPTGGQTLPFQNKGTIRWENLTNCTSHLFFEHAIGQEAKRADTLEIVRFAPQSGYRLPKTCGTPEDSTVLLPYQQVVRTAEGDSALYSVVVTLPFIGFRDTTFARNSGNFRRAVLGEGGSVVGSRALTYDADRGLMTEFDWFGKHWYFDTPFFDMGVSKTRDVSDFIANTYSKVLGVAINFDGALSAVRGDSTYILDAGLRLQGLMQTTGGPNAGFDFHPANVGLGMDVTDPRTRLAFSASSEPQVEVYDTYCYQKLATIPVRDPIVGPIKASLRPNGQMMLVGASASGVVMIPVDRTFPTGCTPAR